MRKRAWLYAAWAGLGAAGCLPTTGSNLPTVPDGRLVAPPPSAATLKAFHAPATEAVALRVNATGQKLAAANPNLPFTPTFQAVGSPEPELFHRDTVIYVSEGLVSRCASEEQLTAVLAAELGRAVSEREAVQALKSRQLDRDPSPALDIGRDSGGPFGAADGTRLAEIAKLDRPRRGVRTTPPAPPPDPRALGQLYAERAGVTSADLNAVAPLLREAAKCTTLQGQITGGGALVTTAPAPASRAATLPTPPPAALGIPAPGAASAAPPGPVTAGAAPAAPTPIATTPPPNIPPGAVLLTPSVPPAAPPAR